MHVCMYVCMYIRMYVCMYVYTYVCMYVYISHNSPPSPTRSLALSLCLSDMTHTCVSYTYMDHRFLYSRRKIPSNSLSLSLCLSLSLSLSLSRSLSLSLALALARSLARSLARARALSLSRSLFLSRDRNGGDRSWGGAFGFYYYCQWRAVG